MRYTKKAGMLSMSAFCDFGVPVQQTTTNNSPNCLKMQKGLDIEVNT
jgi:hypothetical protein